MQENIRAAAIVLAAGSGARSPGTLPKQFRGLAGRPVFIHSAAAFASTPVIDEVVCVLPREHMRLGSDALAGAGLDGPASVTQGGATRQESARKGLAALGDGTELVLIHDAARPLVTRGLIERVVDALQTHAAVNPVVPSRDTVVETGAGGFITRIPPRGSFPLCQTPQGFHRNAIVRAHEHALRVESPVENALDDCMLVLNMGVPVYTVPGETTNMKITHPEDFELAEALYRLLSGGEAQG